MRKLLIISFILHIVFVTGFYIYIHNMRVQIKEIRKKEIQEAVQREEERKDEFVAEHKLEEMQKKRIKELYPDIPEKTEKEMLDLLQKKMEEETKELSEKLAKAQDDPEKLKKLREDIREYEKRMDELAIEAHKDVTKDEMKEMLAAKAVEEGLPRLKAKVDNLLKRQDVQELMKKTWQELNDKASEKLSKALEKAEKLNQESSEKQEIAKSRKEARDLRNKTARALQQKKKEEAEKAAADLTELARKSREKFGVDEVVQSQLETAEKSVFSKSRGER